MCLPSVNNTPRSGCIAATLLDEIVDVHQAESDGLPKLDALQLGAPPPGGMIANPAATHPKQTRDVFGSEQFDAAAIRDRERFNRMSFDELMTVRNASSEPVSLTSGGTPASREEAGLIIRGDRQQPSRR